MRGLCEHRHRQARSPAPGGTIWLKASKIMSSSSSGDPGDVLFTIKTSLLTCMYFFVYSGASTRQSISEELMSQLPKPAPRGGCSPPTAPAPINTGRRRERGQKKLNETKPPLTPPGVKGPKGGDPQADCNNDRSESTSSGGSDQDMQVIFFVAYQKNQNTFFEIFEIDTIGRPSIP